MKFRLSFDLLTLEVLYEENYEKLKNSLVEKIYQIGSTEVFFHLYSPKEGKFVLVLSTHPQFYRIQITKKEFPYPSTPPPFAMFLRKHLEGSKILDWFIVPRERIAEFIFQRMEESKKKLIIELMGKYSNIILVNEEGVILDTIKHITSEKSRFREIIPGKIYLYPPKNEKISLQDLKEEKLEETIDKKSIRNILYITPILEEEILQFEEKEKTKEEILKIKEKILNKDFNFSVYFYDNHPYTFSLFPLEIFKSLKRKEFPKISEAIDYIYSYALESFLLDQLKGRLKNVIEGNVEKVEEKIKEFMEKVREGEKAETLRIKGEALLLYQKDIKKGTERAILPNPYKEGEFLEIELDPSLSPVDNSQVYFKKYKKLKRGINILKEQLKKLEEELFYLNSLEFSLENSSSFNDLQEIEEELINGGYIKEKAKNVRKKKASEPFKFNISGYEVYVGRNNKQNDYVTFNIGGPEDLWFHARGIPGAHVILKLKSKRDIPEEEVIRQTATLAGYFSKGRNSSYVPVDYTKRKYVQKPKEGKPGFVIYKNEKTIFVRPEEGLTLFSQLI